MADPERVEGRFVAEWLGEVLLWLTEGWRPETKKRTAWLLLAAATITSTVLVLIAFTDVL